MCNPTPTGATGQVATGLSMIEPAVIGTKPHRRSPVDGAAERFARGLPMIASHDTSF